ncbi:MAG TPA: acyl-CoA dehydrogenase family protein, partial [Acidimicrobiales bacterium]|nr:acyl-CoA dehydrogenase family protein [Acidimicrobiales bacterium]
MADISLEEFKTEVLDFLKSNADEKAPEEEFQWGKGRDAASLFEEVDRDSEAKQLVKAKEWRAKRFDAGLAYITGPKEYGGRELTQAHERLYNQLESRFEVPGGGFFGIGLGMVAPTILAHASDKAKELYLKKLWRGDLVACQLFSEPGAGSDLASLQTKAEKDGDEWVITGQKVWTSGAQYSDIGEIIARTDPNQPKHKGLTGFIVDMHAPGVEVRPLRQMTGGASFNEVFFNEVRVPDDHRLGDPGQGWTVALTTLMNERASIGAGGAGGGGGGITRLLEMVKFYGQDKDPLVRQELMKLYIGQKIAGYTNQRAMDKIKAG